MADAVQPVRHTDAESRSFHLLFGIFLIPVFIFCFVVVFLSLGFCRAGSGTFSAAGCALLRHGRTLCVHAAKRSAQPLPHLCRGQIKNIQADTQCQHDHDKGCRRPSAQQQQAAAQQCAQRTAADPCIHAVCVAGSCHLECRHALRLDIGKNDHRAAGKHQPKNQLEDLGQKVFASGILHSKAAHCRAQHKAAAAKKSEQHIVQGLPCRISLHKGQHHQQKACKQGAKPRRKPLFCAFFARCCAPCCRFTFFCCHVSLFPAFVVDTLFDFIIVPRREENGKPIVVQNRPSFAFNLFIQPRQRIRKSA